MDKQKLETKKLLDFTPDEIKAYLKKFKKWYLITNTLYQKIAIEKRI